MEKRFRHGRLSRIVNERHGLVFLIPLAASLFAISLPFHATASELPNKDRVISYSVVEQDLADVLGEIGKQAGVRVRVSAAIHGKVHGRIAPATAAELLDRLATLYNLDWFYNNGAVFVSAQAEAGTRLMPLGPVRLSDLTRALDELGISDNRWPVRASGRGIALASGPPDYLALVEQTFGALAHRPADPPVRVLRGSAQSAP